MEGRRRNRRAGRWNPALWGVFAGLLWLMPVGALAQDGVSFGPVVINGRSVPAGEGKIFLYKQLLEGGKIYVTGTVTARAPVASVEVSRDNGKTWRKAALLEGGAFEYAFRPRAPETYALCLRATDETGNQGRPRVGCRELFVSEKSLYSLARETLEEMVEAYENRNYRAFMEHVSEDFYGDKEILDRAVRGAGSRYHDVDIRFTMNSVVPDFGDKVFASVTFNRRYTAVGTGKTVTDGGSSAFVFRLENGRLMLLSMTRPLMFPQ